MSDWTRRIGTWMVVGVTAAAMACGGGAEEPAENGEEAPAEEAGPVVPPDSAATITGVVNFEGTAPGAEPIDMSEEPACADKVDDPAKRPVIVTDGQLANVFVYVKEGLGDRTFPTPSEPVTLDQNGCTYVPHIVAIQTEQTLAIENSDGILHNINTQPSANRGFNISQPVEMTTEREFSQPEVMIPVKCDVHGWMEAYIGVTDHPYAVVTGEDGSFTLENLPPGDYVIEAWHELYGVQTANVSVEAQGSAETSFTYSADMAGAHVPLGEPIDLHDHSGDGQRVASARN